MRKQVWVMSFASMVICESSQEIAMWSALCNDLDASCCCLQCIADFDAQDIRL